MALKKHLQQFSKFLFISIAGLIILFAVLVSISRMLIPLVADYREDLEVIASNALGRTVEVAKISAEWPGLWPSINLQDIKIHGSQDKSIWLEIPTAKVSLNPLYYLKNRTIDATRIDLSGLRLQLERINENQLVVNNETFDLTIRTPEYQEALLNWLFTRDVIKLQDSQITYRVKNIQTPLLLTQVNLYLENNQNFHHAYGQFVLNSENDSSLSFVLDMTGDMLTPQHVSNRVFLKGDIHMTADLQPWVEPYVTIDKGSVMLELWGEGKLEHLDYVKGSIQARELNWSLPNRGDELVNSHIDNLNADFAVARFEDGWSANIKNFTLKKNNVSWPRSNINILYQPETIDKHARLEASASYLKLQDLSGLLSENLPMTLPLRKNIRHLSARGVLSNLNLELQHRAEEIDNIYLNADFNKLGFDRWGELPGAVDLNGKIVIDGSQGSIKLDSESSVLDLGNLFKAPLALNQLAGEIYWQRQAQNTKIYLNDMSVSSDIVEANIAGSVQLGPENSSPFIDLAVDFKNGRAAAAYTYFPRTILTKNVLSWLDNAFVSGRVPDGKMLFHGLASKFPFRNGEGTFLVDFNVEDVRMRYKKDWPQLQGVDANVVFKDSSLHVDVKNAEVMKINLVKSTLDIERLGEGSVVDLNLNMTGRTQRLLNYVYSITSDQSARDYINALRVTGAMNTHWAMSIPLKNTKQFNLKGVTKFNNGDIKLPKWKQSFNKLKGSIEYTFANQKMSYSSQPITGEYLGKPAEFTINTQKQASLTKTNITMKSKTGLINLLGDYISDASAIFSGQSEWNAELTLAEKEFGLMLSSDLKGEQINLPDGFGKSLAATQDIQVSAQMGRPGAEFVRIDYADKLNVVMQISAINDAYNVKRGSIVLGKGKADLAKEDGWMLNGTLDQMTWEGWQNLIPEHKTAPSVSQLAWLNRIDIKIGKLIFPQNQYHQVSLIAIRRINDTRITLGSEELAGIVLIPENIGTTKPVSIDLKYLRFRKSTQELESNILDPRKLPAFILRCENLYLNDQSLGVLDLNAVQTVDGLKISELTLESDVLKIVADGNWLFKNSWHESSFNIDMSTPAIAKAMSLFDFQTNIDQAAASANIQASWSGPPHWFEMKRLNGVIDFNVDKGNMQDISPRGGRIFGLLSIQNLQRRLTLDFSDLFRKGLSFDRIEGRFNISDGDAYTNNLYLDAPSAKIEVQGRIGLATQEYDEDITVIPKISSSIPVLGLAAGPQVAIGLYLTEKVLRKKINELSRIKYNVTGSWDNPIITRISNEQ